jgi:glutamate racemase
MDNKALLKHSKRPIGVFDSGLGGLTVVRELTRTLPHEDIVYFGDLARLPYGAKSKKQIIEFSVNNTLFLLRQKVKAIIIACNSSASSASSYLRRLFPVPIVDVISATAEEAAELSRTGRIAVLGTKATIESGVYQAKIKQLFPRAHVITQSCPLFVPLVEEGWLLGKVTSGVAEHYLKSIKKAKVDVVVLGCTHYPLLKTVIKKAFSKKVALVESAPRTVADLKKILQDQGLLNVEGRGRLSIFVSDKSRNFIEIGSRFLGEPIRSVKIVKW